MGPLTQTPRSPSHRRSPQISPFLPPGTALEMSTQTLRPFRRQSGAAGFGLKSVTPGRAYIFIGTAALTAAGCYEMYKVLQVGGVTILEGMVLTLFVLLFAWIAFSFMSTLAGFVVLLFRMRDRLGIDPAAPLPGVTSRNAMLLPTYNEDPDRITARLRAIHKSVDETGCASQFDWYVLSDTTDPSVWVAEEQCLLRLRSESDLRRPVFLSSPSPKYRAQVGQYRGLDPSVRRRLRSHDHPRRRQPDDRRHHRAPRRRDGSASECRV